VSFLSTRAKEKPANRLVFLFDFWNHFAGGIPWKKYAGLGFCDRQRSISPSVRDFKNHCREEKINIDYSSA